MIVLGSNKEMVMVVHKTIYILIFKKFNLLGRSDAHSHRSVHKCQFEPFSRPWKYHNITFCLYLSLVPCLEKQHNVKALSLSFSWNITQYYIYVFIFLLFLVLKNNTMLKLCLYIFLKKQHYITSLSLFFS